MSRKLSLAYEFSSKTRNNTLPLKDSFNDIQINMCYIKLTSVETTQKLTCVGLFLTRSFRDENYE